MSACKEIELIGRKFKCYSCGKIESFVWNKWRELIGYIQNTGYYCVQINNKKYLKHRIIAYAFLGLDINNPTQQIDHIDHNKINNQVSNLRIVTNQENNFNRICKGYYWNKRDKKWIARICVNFNTIHLGCFDTEDKARLAYIEAKEKYHVIS